jgi:hypothetical protein
MAKWIVYYNLKLCLFVIICDYLSYLNKIKDFDFGIIISE